MSSTQPEMISVPTAAVAVLGPLALGRLDGTLAYVVSRRAWFKLTRTSTAAALPGVIVPATGGGNWVRAVESRDWSLQAAWFVNPTTGSDENDGATGPTALATFQELTRRVPYIVRSMTVTLDGGPFPASDPIAWQPLVAQDGTLTTTPPTLLIVGTRSTAAGPFVIVASTDEVGNAAPTIDAGAALTIGSLIESTNGAAVLSTAVVCVLIAGTTFRTTPWRSTAGARVIPPLAGTSIRQLALTSVPRVFIALPGIIPTIRDLAVTTAVDIRAGQQLSPQTCTFPPLTVGVDQHLVAAGCSIVGTTGTAGVEASSVGSRAFIQLCGIIRTGGASPAISGGNGSVIVATNSVVQGGSDAVRLGRAGPVGACGCNSLGIFGATAQALLIERGFWGSVDGTLYGDASNALGTLVQHGGHMSVLPAITPTLTAAASELSVDGAVAPVTWADWVAVFGRNFASGQLSSIIDRT
jgi:hypothetical protein